jgi:predicted Fe-S protein YdhL (DUF1289 family)
MHEALNAEVTASPCTKICTLDPARTYCLGCFRTLSEIATWSGLPPGAQRAVVAACAARRAASGA